MKTKLKPSARMKKRYLLMSRAGKEEIEKAILDYIGILGYARASPVFASGVILAVSRKEIDNVRAAIEASGIGIKILKVASTLKALEK